MKIKFLIATAIIYVWAACPTTIGSHSWEIEKARAAAEEKEEKAYQKRVEEYLDLKEKWIDNLEMCESGGNKSAVNWYDKDGTASYYSFQFKPATFRNYGERYGIIKKGQSDAVIMQLLKQYDLQKAIVEQMVEDPRVTNDMWRYREFPGCVKKHGLPPKFIIQ